MPLPKPKKEEKKEAFINRCISNDTMLKEYEENAQRFKVCEKQFKENSKE
ncbi:MAG: hypothetical protein ACOCTT_03775 [archaeon]